MKLGIMQPYFFPYIGYWQLINAVDKFVVYDDVSFIKGGWINRNRILINGEAKYINVQMNGASPNKLINEVEVNDNDIFNNKLLKTIEMNYKKALYFDEVFPLIEQIVLNRDLNLSKYLSNGIKEICDYLGIETEISISSNIEKDNTLKGQEKVIEICKMLGANEYYNAIGGQDLYSYEDFSKSNIKLKFLKTGEIEYKQFDNEFIPYLSIIDVMMFNPREEVKKMLGCFELI